MKARLITIYILSLLDLAFTLYLQAKFGEIEANPFGAILLKDKFIACFYKIVIVGLACYILYELKQSTISKVLLAIFILLTIYHIALISYTHYILFMR